MKVALNKTFEVMKGNVLKKWKVIKHPYFPDCLTLVRNYYGMRNGVSDTDYAHICGPVTLEDAYHEAFKMS